MKRSRSSSLTFSSGNSFHREIRHRDPYPPKRSVSLKDRDVEPFEVSGEYLHDHWKEPGFICLYDKNQKKRFLPVYIRNKEPNSPVLTVNSFDDLEINSPNLNDKQTELLKCFTEIIKEMLDGLVISKSLDIWVEPDETRNELSRLQKSTAVLENYHFDEYSLFSTLPSLALTIYRAFVDGFTNGIARSTLFSVFSFCRLLVKDKHAAAEVYNLGGDSCGRGTSHTLQLSCKLGELTREHRDTTAYSLFKQVDDGLQDVFGKAWAPGCVMLTVIPDNYFLFGECKSSSSEEIEMQTHLWHQSLHGLLTSDAVYAVGIYTECVQFYKLSKTDTEVTTFKCEINLRKKVTEDDRRCFNVEGFMKFVKNVIKIAQTNCIH